MNDCRSLRSKRHRSSVVDQTTATLAADVRHNALSRLVDACVRITGIAEEASKSEGQRDRDADAMDLASG
jgi:hypothetical protein